MKFLRALLWWAAILAAVTLGLPALGASFWLTESVLVAIWALAMARLAYCTWARRRAPEAYRAYVAEHFDPAAGPPPDAVAVEEPVVDRWFAAADVRAAADLLASDFRYRAPGRDWPRWLYVRSLRVAAAWVPETSRLEAVLADPAEPDLVWVRQSSVARPPRGGAEIHTGAWHRWTLTPDRQRIRAFALVAFVEPLVHV